MLGGGGAVLVEVGTINREKAIYSAFCSGLRRLRERKYLGKPNRLLCHPKRRRMLRSKFSRPEEVVVHSGRLSFTALPGLQTKGVGW